MNIIIEGPDAAGKTLYAKEFQKYGFNYMKCSPGEHAYISELSNDYFSRMLNFDNYVFDRFCISELVFSELYSRDEVITFEEVNKLLANNLDDTKMVLLYSSNDEILKQRCIDRGELDYVDEVVEQNKLFVKYYWVFAAYESENIYLIDIAKYNTIEDVKQVVKDVLGEK